MLQYFIGQTLIWVLLVAGAVLGGAAGLRWGKIALIVVLVLLWPVILFADLFNLVRLAPQALELNSPGELFRNSWPAATLHTVAVLVPMLFALKTSSLRKVMVWAIAAPTIWCFAMPIPLTFIACLFGDCL